ncbi:hypothetical protein PVAP13_6NG213206 [Panicum virgatum]|uniref:Uncharacterized protein n=1 Tax=Panicum virgatum TaxID=38727 RepID=A0A8T0QZI8_PANVG|nr:hypothetical protein PVAP13_6NG213206 [Panicum virgatum]
MLPAGGARAGGAMATAHELHHNLRAWIRPAGRRRAMTSSPSSSSSSSSSSTTAAGQRSTPANAPPRRPCPPLRAVTDYRHRRPFSDSERRSSGDASALLLGAIFSDLLRLGSAPRVAGAPSPRRLELPPLSSRSSPRRCLLPPELDGDLQAAANAELERRHPPSSGAVAASGRGRAGPLAGTSWARAVRAPAGVELGEGAPPGSSSGVVKHAVVELGRVKEAAILPPRARRPSSLAVPAPPCLGGREPRGEAALQSKERRSCGTAE